METLHEAFEYPLTRLDPVRGDHVDPPSVAIFQTLLRKGPQGQPLPGLAESWQVIDGGRTWRLRIQPGARFHSGDRCDARAVVRALEHCRWGDGWPRQVWYWDPVDTVEEADEGTVSIRLHEPCSRLPALLWGAHTAIANPDPWLRLGDEFGLTCADGTGPYRLVSYDPAQVIAERIRPGAGPDRIHWHAVEDPADRVCCLQDPRMDIVRQVEVDDLAPGWRGTEQPENGQYYLALDFGDERGFGQVDMRRCIDAFIDRELLLARCLGGRGAARPTPIPQADEFASEPQSAATGKLSPEQARARLASLGWQPDASGIWCRGTQRMSMPCIIQDTPVGRSIGAEVARQLRAAGIELILQPTPVFEAFYQSVGSRPPAFISKWLWPDAMEAIMGFTRMDCIQPAGGNWQAANCPQVDACYDEFLAARSPADLAKASSAAQRAFMEHLPYLPLVSCTESIAVRDEVSGFGLVPRTLYPSYEQVHRKREMHATDR